MTKLSNNVKAYLSEEKLKAEIMNSFNDFDWPVYHGNLVTVTGKDESGITWVATMRAEAFHNSMRKAALNYGKNK